MTTTLAALQKIAETLAADDGGVLGVAAGFLPTGETVFHNADDVFPTASVIKVAIVAELYTQAAEGRVNLDRPIQVPDDRIAGSGILSTLSPGLVLPLSDVAMLTISVSDNTASNLCLAAVGGLSVVNARMRNEWGMTATVIHRPIKFGLEPGDPPHTATGTPRDMMHLLILLAEGKIHDRATSDAVLRLMAEVGDTGLLPRSLEVNPYADDLRIAHPPFRIEHKTGKVTGVRNDAALIRRGAETLAVCVYTKEIRDSRWTPANAGEEAAAEIGRVLSTAFFA